MIKKSLISVIIALSVIMQSVPGFAARFSETLSEDILLALCAYGKVGIHEGGGEVLNSPPYIKDESFMLPVRWTFENWGILLRQRKIPLQ